VGGLDVGLVDPEGGAGLLQALDPGEDLVAILVCVADENIGGHGMVIR
jgi:hypothetical protein